MKRILCSMLTAGLLLAMTTGFPATLTTRASASPRPGQSIEIRLQDGSRWRGELGTRVTVTFKQQYVEVQFVGRLVKAADLYIVVEGDIAGEIRQKTIFRDDIVSLSNAASDPDAEPKTRRRAAAGDRDRAGQNPGDDGDDALGVIVLPLEGFVGGPFRREEIVKVGEKADELGPGQIIVLLINTNGGSSVESQFIADEIFKLRERHRVVAWIEKAISAGCQTAMCCQERYFKTTGSAGAVTTWDGQGTSIKGEQLKKTIAHLVDLAKRAGIDGGEFIAPAMKTNSAMCSYTKDPETGEIEWYGDLSGEVILSDADSNLSFTASSALDCGFSNGTADTEEELARLLDLPRWHEVTNYGRAIAKSWQTTFKRAEAEVPLLVARREYDKTSGGIKERLGALISLNKQMIRWWDRCPNFMEGRYPDKNTFERENAQLRKQLADIRRAGG